MEGVQLAPSTPNVELRGGDVVFAFPYDAALVDAMRAMPGRRFDWERKEWRVPAQDEAAPYVRDVLDRWPALVAGDDVLAWLGRARTGWIGRVTARRHAGEPAFVVRIVAGALPEALAPHARTVEAIADARTLVLPFAAPVAEALLEDPGVHLDRGAALCAQHLQVGLSPPPARLVVEHSVAEARFALEVLWDRDAVRAFDRLPGADTRGHALPIDGWALEPLEHLLRTFGVTVAPSAAPHLEALRAEHEAAVAAIRRSRAREAAPLDPAPALAGGELAPFQWAGVRYVLDARRAFLAAFLAGG